MQTNLIDLRRTPKPSAEDLAGLSACLAQLVGEPFRFARVSYGDELTLHFGDTRPARSPKLNDRFLYGAYILFFRGYVMRPYMESLVGNATVPATCRLRWASG